MKLTVLGSSSKGNCYLLEYKNRTLILDAGVKFKDVQKALNFNLSNVLGVLITHEHMDHLKYATDFALNGINVYASEGTFKKLNLSGHRFKIIKALEQFRLDVFEILPFDIQHDANEPLGFLIQNTETQEKLLYATDTYYIKYKFNKLNYLLIECNYILEIVKKNIQENIVNKSRYKRLLESHLSLENLIKFLKANDLSNTKKIVICHLSDQNSNEQEMIDTINKITKIETIAAKSNMQVRLELYPF